MILAVAPAQAPPINPQIKGLTKRRLIPKITGSVIPKNAGIIERNIHCHVFSYFECVKQQR